MGEQVADRRTLWASRLVQIDHPLLRRDKCGEGGDELRDRRPAEHAVARTTHRDDVRIPHDAGSRSRRGPLVDAL